ncbi:MAG: adenylate/guanylate cyclase domain-containing protein [Candidatus Cloacimonetes bacterium]|nr:adenylate/guanylate cyclase domain-containing protein [Candidatus Cloacimonadota bacterium]
MSYYKLQSIFFMVICSIYILVTQVSYQLDSSLNVDRERSHFQNILSEKNQLLTGIKSKDEEIFSNYPKKLKIIEITSSPFLQKLSKILSNKGWKKALRKEKIPFAQQSCLIIGKNGSTKVQIGHKMDDIFDKGWDKSIFLALNNPKTMYSRLQAIYRYPVTPEEFQNYFQSFQVLYHKNNQFVFRYYTKVKKLDVFYLVRLNMVNKKELINSTLDFFESSYPNIKSGHNDTIILGENSEVLNSTKDGLWYKANYISYFDYISKFVYFNCFFVLILAILYAFGGYRVIAIHFEFKFLIIYLFFIYMLSLVFLQSFEYLKNNKRDLLKREYESKWLSHIKLIEDQYFSYREELRVKILKEFDTDTMFKGDLWNGDIYGIWSTKGKSILSHQNLDSFNYSWLTRYMPYLAGKQPELPIQTDKLADISSYLGIQEDPEKAMFTDFFVGNNKRKTIFDGGKIFSTHSFRIFKSIPIMGQSIEILFAKKGVGEDYQLMLTKTTMASLQSQFFKSHKIGPDSPSLIIKSQRSREDFFKHSYDKPISVQEFDSLYTRFLNQKGSMIEFRKNDQDYFAMFLKSNVFKYYDLLFLIEKDVLYASLDKMQTDLYRFVWFFYIAVLLISYLLTKVILKPIRKLKKGLIKVKHNDLDVQLEVKGQDESAQVITQFNSMVLELQRKEKMLPFISSAVFELLRSGSGKIDTKYSGNAVVLFSDIKSFTKISETRDPQEVVDMLNDYFSIWQEKIERNGGIVDRFIGDAISVVYFEKSSHNFIQQAIQTSVEVMEALQKLNKTRKENGEFVIENGVGLVFGEVYFSMVGDENKMEFLIQGIPVALSEYLEGQSRYSNHSHIILDPYIKKAAEYQYDFAEFEVEDKSLGKFYELVL